MNNKRIITALLTALVACAAWAGERPMTVDSLMALTDRNSASLHTRLAAVAVATEGVDAARSQRLPSIDASLSVSYLGNALVTTREFSEGQWTHTPHLGNSFALQVQQVVYSGGAITAGVDLARVQRQQAENNVALTRQQQRFLALGQYLDIYKAVNRLRVLEQNIGLTRQLVEQINSRYEQGMALKNDVTRYELQLQTLQLQQVQLQNQRTTLNHQLCNTLGLPPETLIVPDSALVTATYARQGEEAWQRAATQGSPVLRQKSLDTQAARASERLARSELLPHVALVVADELNGPITYEVPPLNRNINIWYVGVGVTYSLSSLFKSNHKLRQAQAATRMSQLAQSEAALSVNNAVQAAHTEYEQSYVELATQQKSVELARQNYQVMSDRYLNQLALVTDMVEASNLKLNAELQEVDARINIAYAYYKMRYLAGQL